MNRGKVIVAGLVALAAAGAFARSSAQAEQPECVLDRCLGEKRGSAPPLRPQVAPGAFDYYVLALSWSPGFCAVSGGRRDEDQCAPGAGQGFVVHGLWPQRPGDSPADCEAGLRPPARADVAAVRDLFPSEGLARYQWRKHGGCTGLPPSAYFADVRRARGAVRIPEMFSGLRSAERVEPQDVLRAFRDANPRLRPGMAAVSCPRNVLQEVRVCLSKDLRDFVPCPEVASRSCRARDIAVPPPL